MYRAAREEKQKINTCTPRRKKKKKKAENSQYEGL